MKFICNRKKFKTLEDARDYANRLFVRFGVIAGIEKLPTKTGAPKE